MPDDWEDKKPQEGRWVMTSHLQKKPWCLTFYIGAITVAEIFFEGKGPHLLMWAQTGRPIRYSWQRNAEDAPTA